MEHRADIEQWRQQLPLAERLRKHHPNTIWRGWEADKRKAGLPTLADEKQATSGPPKRRAAAEIADATARLHQTIDGIEGRLGPDLASLFDLSPDHIGDSVRNFVDIFGQDDARRFAQLLIDTLAPSAPEPVIADTAFANSITIPKRTRRRGIKSLDNPERPRNRTTKFKGSGGGLDVEIRWPKR